MKRNNQTFWLLAVAYILSMAYQYYRYTLHEHPADTFGVTEIAGYVLLIGWSALALVSRKWAILAVIVLCAMQLSIGLFYYFPVIFRQRHDYFWDWAEALVFMLLITLAGGQSVKLLHQTRRRYNYR